MKKISGTKEWASSNENILFGCQHDCLYCYAKAMSVRHKKIDIKKWHEPILRVDKLNKKIGKRSGTIMFPTTHDIHPDNLDESIYFLGKLLKPGNNVLIVSKPHVGCIDQICYHLKHFKDQILFRFTIGSPNNDVLKFWEPNAPNFEDRLLSLKTAFSRGFKTSISCEPMLDSNESMINLFNVVSDYVTDSVWFGKLNTPARCKINGAFGEKFQEILHVLGIWQSGYNITKLYNILKDNKKVKWKESIKEIVGIDRPSEKGLDI